MNGSLLGPRFANDDIGRFLKAQNAPHHFIADEKELLAKVVAAMTAEKVVGWFQDRMEFGPRALGARSIIGDARSEKMQSQMNLRIKFRESFRPFAPSVLIEDVPEYFELDRESPYMLLVAPVREDKRCRPSEEQQRAMKDPDLRKRVNVKRSTIPAITHVDMSARIQSVDEQRNGRYYRLIREFKRQTGCGVIINTSFNIRGEPIVCTPQDAYRCFLASDMDVLVLENYVLYKSEQPQLSTAEREKYLGSFSLD
jgi:carbamoyltransferase